LRVRQPRPSHACTNAESASWSGLASSIQPALTDFPSARKATTSDCHFVVDFGWDQNLAIEFREKIQPPYPCESNER
jgi:hypothetical protein